MVNFVKDTGMDVPTGHGSQFALKKDAAIAALLMYGNTEGAAKATGISTNTLNRWKQVPEFKAAYLKAQREAFSECIARLQLAASSAVNTLTEIVLDSKVSASSRVRAAETILNQARQGIEVADLLARVEVLEQKEEAA
jgi:hypothetical protein